MTGAVLVTGCTGHVATHLAPVLRAMQPGVPLAGVALADAPDARERFDRMIAADLRDREAVGRLLADVQPSAIVHLAALRSGALSGLLEANAVATDHLLSAARERLPAGVRVVVVGSAAELGVADPARDPLAEDAPCRPIDAYGVSKLAQSALASAAYLRHGQQVVRVRIFNLVGPGLPADLLPGRCARLLAAFAPAGRGGHLSFRDLGTERDYVDTRDACRAIALALTHAPAGELFHVGGGRAVSGRRLVEQLIALARPATGPVTFDETVDAPPTVPRQRADIGHAERVLGWRPGIAFERSLDELWHSVLDRPAGAPTPHGGA